MLGFHLSSARDSLLPGVTEWHNRCLAVDHLGCCQFYAHGPRNDRCLIGEEEGRRLAALPLLKIIHGAYTTLPLNKREWFERAVKELNTGRRIGAHGVVVHIKNGWRENLVPFLHFLETHPQRFLQYGTEIAGEWPVLYLENHAVKSNPYTLDNAEKLAWLGEHLRGCQARVGLCLDTAHLWGNGLDLRGEEEARRFLVGVPREIPVMFHLNDSLAPLGSGVDRHAPVGGGTIWGGVIPRKIREPSAKNKQGYRQKTIYEMDPGKIIPYPQSGAAEIVRYAVANSCPLIMEAGGTAEVDRAVCGLSPREL